MRQMKQLRAFTILVVVVVSLVDAWMESGICETPFVVLAVTCAIPNTVLALLVWSATQRRVTRAITVNEALRHTPREWPGARSDDQLPHGNGPQLDPRDVAAFLRQEAEKLKRCEVDESLTRGYYMQQLGGNAEDWLADSTTLVAKLLRYNSLLDAATEVEGVSTGVRLGG